MTCQLSGAGSLTLHQNPWLEVPRLLAGTREWWIEPCLESLPSKSQLGILQPPEWGYPGWKPGPTSPSVHSARAVDRRRTNGKALVHSPREDARTAPDSPLCPGASLQGEVPSRADETYSLSSVWLLSLLRENGVGSACSANLSHIPQLHLGPGLHPGTRPCLATPPSSRCG